METPTTTKTRRKRITTGILITSTNRKKYNTIIFLESLGIKVVAHFNPISYTNKGYSFINT